MVLHHGGTTASPRAVPTHGRMPLLARRTSETHAGLKYLRVVVVDSALTKVTRYGQQRLSERRSAKIDGRLPTTEQRARDADST